MTTTPSSPPTLADWRRLALEAIDDAIATSADDDLMTRALRARRDALLAAEDSHPPTFHVRPVWIAVHEPSRQRREYANKADVFDWVGGWSTTKQWRWGAREANGEIVIPESEPLTDRAHAIAMAKRFAAGVGGRVVDDETGEEL